MTIIKQTGNKSKDEPRLYQQTSSTVRVLLYRDRRNYQFSVFICISSYHFKPEIVYRLHMNQITF